MTNSTNLSIDEWNELSNGLAKFHCIFYRFWTVCRPVFSDRIKTAAVAFDKEGNCVEFMINPVFWAAQTPVQKLFIICHECLHLIFNHGKRAKRIFGKSEAERLKLNVAMDICVNEALVERYGFIRAEIDPENKYVWLDKVRVELNLPNIQAGKCFEYYYNLFQSAPDAPFMPSAGGGTPSVGSTVDEHTEPGEADETEGSDALERMASELDENEAETLDNMLRDEQNVLQRDMEYPTNSPAGVNPLGHTYKLKIEKVVEKKKWETIIKKWASRYMVTTENTIEQWAKTSRRFALLDDSLSLPQESDDDVVRTDKTKIEVWFFLDTSGSCIHLAKRFFAAAMSLPKHRFNVHLYCFDTKVYSTDMKKRQVYGGGGTNFGILEKYIVKQTVDKGAKYPDAVFVITDGYGTEIKPQKPSIWHWFLSEDMFTFIPPESKSYKLKDFE